MSHAHPHDHTAASARAFAWGIGLNAAYVAVELAAGWWANSLALFSDALHNLSDIVALAVAWLSATLATRKPSARRTYGWSRATILSALFSSGLLFAAMGVVAWEAAHRLTEPHVVAGGGVALVAALGVVINSATAWFLSRGRANDLNVHSIWLNMFADAALSALVVVAGIVMMYTHWYWVDPVASLLLAISVSVLAAGVLRDALNLATDAVPPNIDPDAVRSFLRSQRGVREAHDLHIWPLSTTSVALTAHLVMPDPPASDDFILDLNEALQERFGIDHTAIQIERGNGIRICPDSDPDHV